MRVLSVGGYSKTGKTTTVVQIISELKRKGYSVASIKDIHFEAFTMEREGSDSWKHQQAGAETVIARGMKETFRIQPRQLPLQEMLKTLHYDWVVVEGMKSEPLPKIITAESEEQLEELVDDNVFCITGKISKSLDEFRGIPVIDNLQEPNQLLKIVEEKVFEVLPLSKEECCRACGLTCYQMVGEILRGKRSREECKTDGNRQIRLTIGDEEIKLVPFVQKVLRDIIIAFISNLHGYRKDRITIEL